MSISPLLGPDITTFSKAHLPVFQGQPPMRLIGKKKQTKGYYSMRESRNRNLSVTEQQDRKIRLS